MWNDQNKPTRYSEINTLLPIARQKFLRYFKGYLEFVRCFKMCVYLSQVFWRNPRVQWKPAWETLVRVLKQLHNTKNYYSGTGLFHIFSLKTLLELVDQEVGNGFNVDWVSTVVWSWVRTAIVIPKGVFLSFVFCNTRRWTKPVHCDDSIPEVPSLLGCEAMFTGKYLPMFQRVELSSVSGQAVLDVYLPVTWPNIQEDFIQRIFRLVAVNEHKFL